MIEFWPLYIRGLCRGDGEGRGQRDRDYPDVMFGDGAGYGEGAVVEEPCGGEAPGEINCWLISTGYLTEGTSEGCGEGSGRGAGGGHDLELWRRMRENWLRHIVW